MKRFRRLFFREKVKTRTNLGQQPLEINFKQTSNGLKISTIFWGGVYYDVSTIITYFSENNIFYFCLSAKADGNGKLFYFAIKCTISDQYHFWSVIGISGPVKNKNRIKNFFKT